MPDANPALPKYTLRRGGMREALESIAGGESVAIVLYEDTALSPFTDSFAHAVMESLATLDDRVAGASLSIPRFRPKTRIPFSPLLDGGDVFYARPASSAAMLFWPTAAQRLLAHWPGQRDDGLVSALVQMGCYLIVPRAPLAHDRGKQPTEFGMLAQADRKWQIPAWKEALAVYDETWEIGEDQAKKLLGIDIPGSLTVDLWGQRPTTTHSDYLISSRPCRSPIAQFALELVPPEANLTINSGNGLFSLGLQEDFGELTEQSKSNLYRHATRHNAFDDYISQLLGPLRKIMTVLG